MRKFVLAIALTMFLVSAKKQSTETVEEAVTTTPDIYYDDSSNSTDSSNDWDYYLDGSDDTTTDLNQDFGFDFVIDEETLEELINEAAVKVSDFVENTSESLEEARQSVQDAYKQAFGRYLLDYGKIFAPLQQEIGEYLGNIQTQDAGYETCDTSCGALCWDPTNFDENTIGFNTSCLTGCGCELLILTEDGAIQLDFQEQLVELNIYLEQAKQLVNETQGDLENNLDTVQSDLVTAITDNLDDFRLFINETAVDTFGCDIECTDYCAFYSDFKEIITCIGDCECQQSFVDVDYEDSNTYNYAELLEYSEYNLQAWSFFKKYQFDY